VGDEVKFTDEQWETVAQAAETFAGVLSEERAKLHDVIVTNWAGDCGEGEGVIENLRELVRGDSGFVGAITSENEYLINLALRCRQSKQQLNQVDIANSSFTGKR
jgi:hypothetical protein